MSIFWNLLDAGDPEIGIGDLTNPLVDEAGDLERYGAQVVNGVDKGLHGILLQVAHHPMHPDYQ